MKGSSIRALLPNPPQGVRPHYHWLSRSMVSRSVCAHAQSARAGDSRGDAHAPVIADPPPRRRTSSVGSAPGECCARHVPRTLLTSRYGSRVGRGAGMCPAWPLRFDTRAPCAQAVDHAMRRTAVRPRALRPLRDTALGGMAWLRAVLCQHHWHGGHIQERMSQCACACLDPQSKATNQTNQLTG